MKDVTNRHQKNGTGPLSWPETKCTKQNAQKKIDKSKQSFI
jgi:hypothetical protein